MRFIRKIIMGLLLFTQYDVGAQCVYDNFLEACTTQVDATWVETCGAGWKQSHGSPNMIYYNDQPPGYPKPLIGHYAFMWSTSYSNVVEGEGMYRSATFKANVTYTITIRLAAFGEDDAVGSVKIYGVNGLTKSTAVSLPTVSPTNKQLIGSYSGFTPDRKWTDVKFTFTPTQDFSQIWIYPEATSPIQYNAQVMWVGWCESCDGTIVYNSGNVPVGTSKSGNILAGSSAGTGGAGTVSVNAGQNTSLMASTAIELLPNFSASTTNSGSFTATVVSCHDLKETFSIYPRTADSVLIVVGVPPINLYHSNQPVLTSEMPKPDNGQVIVKSQELPIRSRKEQITYPTVGSGKFTIAGPIDANSAIQVFDNSGRLRHYKDVKNKTNEFKLDLYNLGNGTYIVAYTSRTKRIIQKIIIQK